MDKLLHDFLKFEKDEKLFQRKWRDVYYWQTMRFSVVNIVNKICIEPVYIKKKKNRKWFEEKFHILRNALYDIKNWHKLKRADILYFDQCSYRIVSGEKVDSNFDYFKFEQVYSVQRCFYLNRGDGKKYRGKGVGTANAELKVYFFSFIAKMFSFIFDEKEKFFICKLCGRINFKYHTQIDSDQMIFRAKKASIFYNVYYKYYLKLINKIKPKTIFVVCHYSDNLWPLYSAAKKIGIPVIELEHGTVVDHISYNYMDKSDLGKQLPDYFFSYGEFWDEYINFPSCVKVYPIGNPFLENRCEYYADKKMDNKKIVIYSDTWEQNGRKLMQLAKSISNKYYTEGYKIFFKLHPCEYLNWKEKYIDLKNDIKITVLTDEIELYKLLSMARHQIGVFSTVLYEAVAFDSTIYIFDSGVESMLEGSKPLIDLKRAYLIHDFSEFEQFMLLDKKQYEDVKDNIWKRDACMNAQRVLQSIVS